MQISELVIRRCSPRKFLQFGIPYKISGEPPEFFYGLIVAMQQDCCFFACHDDVAHLLEAYNGGPKNSSGLVLIARYSYDMHNNHFGHHWEKEGFKVSPMDDKSLESLANEYDLLVDEPSPSPKQGFCYAANWVVSGSPVEVFSHMYWNWAVPATATEAKTLENIPWKPKDLQKSVTISLKRFCPANWTPIAASKYPCRIKKKQLALIGP